jgi:hypothetical protein
MTKVYSKKHVVHPYGVKLKPRSTAQMFPRLDNLINLYLGLLFRISNIRKRWSRFLEIPGGRWRVFKISIDGVEIKSGKSKI